MEIREMRPEEAKAVRKLGRKTFEPFESIFVPMPKACYVAVEDEEIIGAVLYKYLPIVGKKIGYVDYIFVDKKGHGKGVGSQLVEVCLNKMRQEGCDGISAIVRDDNVGSWKMFVNEGMKRVGLYDLIKYFGIGGMLSLTFKTPLNFATGMEFYLNLDGDSHVSKKENTWAQIITYIVLTMILLLPSFDRGIEYGVYILLGVSSVLGIRMAAGYLGTLFSKEDWHFRTTEGGYLIPLVTSFIGGIYLISGNWYPKTYRRGPEFKRALGLTALFQWLSLLLIILLMRTPLADIEFIDVMASVAAMLMVVSVVPFYPLASFGGKRIFDWNKGLYMVVLAVSIYLVLL